MRIIKLEQIKLIVILFLLISQSSITLAVPERFYPYNPNNGNPVTLTQNADSFDYAQTIALTGSTRLSNPGICSDSSLNYTLTRIDFRVPGALSGTYQATSAHQVLYLYDVGVPGFAVAPLYNSWQFNADLTKNNTINRPIPMQQGTAWRGSIAQAQRITGTAFDTFGQVYIYKDATRIQSGTQVIPQQTVLQYLCYDSAGTLQEISSMRISALTVNAKLSTCTPDSASSVIAMDSVPLKTIQDASEDTLVSSKSQTFSLTCDPSIRLKFSVNDQNDPSNTSRVSSLTSDSTATGVGYGIMYNSTRLTFGPDSSAMNTPGVTQLELATPAQTAANPRVSYNLVFGYVRKTGEEVKKGTANSLVGITYSYQ
ncbi:hypothetical protein DKL61_11015 [Gammaproteobacteria bacterium ESL0073]|nr:hypothetical protein DKL61_11015 [Gammaproteobacteria bacterium ESL0073]